MKRPEFQVLKSRTMPRVPFRLLLASQLLIPVLVAQTSTEVEITSEPSHHLAIENEYVHVFKVEVAPHSSTLMHRHRHDYLFVTIGDSDVMNEVAGKAAVELKLADAETRFSPGNFAHVAKNLSDQPFRNVTIELLQDEASRQAPSRWPMDLGIKTFPGGHRNVLFIKDGARVSEIDLDPGVTVPSHHHDGPHLMVAISDLDLRSGGEGGSSETWKLAAGDVKWLPASLTHSLTNTSTRTARFVTVEF
jgi:quercetin dioxygenase-like cupin family protein